MGRVLALRDHPELKDDAALWFSEKWGIPASEYRASMDECISCPKGIPQWYVMLNQADEIIAGAGLIENDFHQRSDLSPNLCALYVEEPYRLQGNARNLLNYIRVETANLGYDTLYLVTDHDNFYEKCGWQLFGMVISNEGDPERMYSLQTFTSK